MSAEASLNIFRTTIATMTSAAPTKRQQTPNSLPSGKGAAAWYYAIFQSSVGSKFLVALTGIGLTGFVIAHMLGNLQIFAGADKINRYAKFLKDLGPGLWAARIGLLILLIVHMFFSIRLQKRAAKARPIPYVHEDTIQASVASRYMLQTGLVIFVFLLFHLAHYTFGWIGHATINNQPVSYLELHDPVSGLHDVYAMTILGFRNPLIAILYIVAQIILAMHLSHGVSSVFQTLGANGPRWQPAIRILGWAVALIVGLGNIVIVVAVWAGAVPLPAYLVP
jgi:succinate dehydrogenase / fumarate reductase, cytochrome b subunit